MQKMVTCLWFAKEAQEAAKFYTSIFKTSRLGQVTRYGNEGQEVHGGTPGAVLTVEFELNGMKFIALNGGPMFNFNESVSFQVICKTQKEVDYYWKKLTSRGGREVQCGWLKDKYGVSWQITPAILGAYISSRDRTVADRAMKAMLPMKKIDIRKIEEAVHGKKAAKGDKR